MPALSATQVSAVRNAWMAAIADPERLAERTFERLHARAPGAPALFSEDPATRTRTVVETLAIVVDALDSLDGIDRTLRELGRAHAARGVTPELFAALKAALLDALAETVGPEFDPSVRAAWDRAFDRVAERMRRSPAWSA